MPDKLVYVGVFLMAVWLLVTVLAIVLMYRKHIVPHLRYDGLNHDPDKKIDAVFTWVDGNDPKYIENRAAASKTRNVSNTKARYHNVNEIQYAVRAVKRQPWIRNVYVVTPPGHKLQSLENEVVWVDQNTLLPPMVLRPCFNSNVIELFIHTIPGLSEDFLYFCDDMLLNKQLYTDFFHLPDGKMRFSVDNWGIDALTASCLCFGTVKTANSRYHTHLELSKTTNLPSVSYFPLIYHGPIIVNRQLFQTCIETIPLSDLRRYCTHQFRKKEDLVFLYYYWPHWAVANGYGKFTSGYHAQYVHIDDHYQAVKQRLEHATSSGADIICLNDSRTRNFNNTDRLLKDWLCGFQNRAEAKIDS
jgi:hypothetical protein